MFRRLRHSIAFLAVVLGMCSFAQAQTQQQRFDSAVQEWNLLRADASRASEGFESLMASFLNSGDISAYKDTLRQLCKLGIGQSSNRDCRLASFKTLAALNDPVDHSYIDSLINDAELQFEVARNAIRWNWDLCAPVLAQAMAYDYLGRDARAIPYLLQGVNSSDLGRRFHAATALARYHKGYSSYLLPAARAYVRADTARQENDEAMVYLKDSGTVEDMDALELVATRGRDAGSRTWALRYVAQDAKANNPYALAALQRIRDTSIAMDIREQAEIFLSRLDSTR